MGDNQDFLAFIRVTLLGHARSGKSSLVNNVVNNAFSPAYTRTTESTLYYSVVRIKDNQDALLEIEDTFGSNDVGDVAGIPDERQIGDFYDFWWPSTREGSMEEQKRLQGLQKVKGDAFLVAKKEGKECLLPRSLEKPLGLYEAPTDGRFYPLTKNRMAWLIVFDVNCEDSYKEAVKVYEGLDEYHKKKQSPMRPLIHFVANKSDKDPTSPKFQRVWASASAYADLNSVPLQLVSALQFQGVKKMFRSIVQAVQCHQLLWMLEGDTAAEEEEDGKTKCTVQ